MNTYEKLQEEACKDGIDVIDYPFKSKKIKGLYCDGTIAIKDNIDTTTEKACVLAEELGHHYTSVGNIIDMEYTGNRKQERQARLWGYNRSIGLFGRSELTNTVVKINMKLQSIWMLQKNIWKTALTVIAISMGYIRLWITTSSILFQIWQCLK